MHYFFFPFDLRDKDQSLLRKCFLICKNYIVVSIKIQKFSEIDVSIISQQIYLVRNLFFIKPWDKNINVTKLNLFQYFNTNFIPQSSFNIKFRTEVTKVKLNSILTKSRIKLIIQKSLQYSKTGTKMPNNFLQIQVNFTQENHCSVFFAHLQNILRKFISNHTLTSSENVEVEKICRVLNDIYSEHSKLERSFDQLSKSTQDMMQEFAGMLNQFKDDREKLLTATKDRFDMLSKLKQYNQNMTTLQAENGILKQTVDRLKEINDLLMEKAKVTEEQLENRNIAEVGYESFQRITSQYDRLLTSNTQIRKQLAKICNQSQSLQKIAKPIQIINKAIKSNPKLKQQIWHIAQQNGNNIEFAGYEKLFLKFDFDQFIKEIREQSAQ